jgi:hypothetical protein
MSLRTLAASEVLASLSGAVDPLVRDCAAAIERDGRPTFTVTDVPARELVSELQFKWAAARRASRTILGEVAVADGLTDLGDQLVTGVFVQESDAHYAIYLRSSDLGVVGAVVMRG